MATREDFIGQNNPAILKYATDNGLIPDDVLDSPMIQEEDLAGLANTAFANPYNRTYPCHTKVACVNSALWDAATHPGNELITANIKKMAAAQGLTEEVNAIYNHFENAFTKAAAAQPTQAAPEETYALTLTHDDGTADNFFPTTYPLDVVHSAEDADRQYRAGNIGDSIFRKVASAIVEAAHAHRVAQSELPRNVRVIGTMRVPDPYMAELAVQNFCKRSNVNPDPYMSEIHALQGAMEQVETMEDAIKMASVVADHLCDMNAANGLFAMGEDSPYALIFQGPEMGDFMKHAGSTVYVMDVPIPAQEIINLPANMVDTRFAPQAVEMIHSAQAKLQEEAADDMAKVAAAAEILSQLSPGAKRQLLLALSQS